MTIFLTVTKLVGDVPTQQVGLLPSVSGIIQLVSPKDEGGSQFAVLQLAVKRKRSYFRASNDRKNVFPEGDAATMMIYTHLYFVFHLYQFDYHSEGATIQSSIVDLIR